MKWIKRLFGREAAGSNGSDGDSGMISCQDALERLYEYLDKELDDSWQDRVTAHFDVCSRCYPHLTFERTFLDVVRKTEPTEGPPEELKGRILELLAKEGLEPS
jgi:anti-sigma factor (TIGR02949 family)